VAGEAVNARPSIPKNPLCELVAITCLIYKSAYPIACPISWQINGLSGEPSVMKINAHALCNWRILAVARPDMSVEAHSFSAAKMPASTPHCDLFFQRIGHLGSTELIFDLLPEYLFLGRSKVNIC
jgi:hypothetical protein